jgi:molybdenum cofactor cytidylyltransferase
MTSLSAHHIAIIMLAAGEGRRMGSAPGVKLLLPLADGRPIIAHAVRNAMALEPSELVVVVRPDMPEVTGAAILGAGFVSPMPGGPPVRYITNPRHEEGMATSLAAGISALGEEIEAVLVMLGDMPHVAGDIVDALVSAYLSERKPITIPRYGSAVGPPTLFARPVFPDLLRLEGEVGGRQLLSKYPDLTHLVPFAEGDRPGDIDTVDDYERTMKGPVEE